MAIHEQKGRAMIRVVNIRDLPEYPSVILKNYQVYIGRANKHVLMKQSPLANPFNGKTYGRDGAIAKFADWIDDRLLALDNDVCQELKRLARIHKTYGMLELVCWCAPKACHGDIIAQVLSNTSH